MATKKGTRYAVWAALAGNGMARSTRPADRSHPFGHGREVYFWSFVVSLLIFILGAGAAVYEGIAPIRAPQPIEQSGIIFGVLAVSLAFEGTSWWIGLRTAALATGDARWDGVASLVIAAILVAVAILIAQEFKQLPIGERAA